MLTQCPNCDTTFRVTREILRVAQGQVRCGRCETQFDALERLIEEDAEEEIDAAAELDTEADDLQLSEPDLEDELSEPDPQDEEETQPEVAAQEQEEEEEWVEFDDIEAQSELVAATDPAELLADPTEAAEQLEEEETAQDYEQTAAQETEYEDYAVEDDEQLEQQEQEDEEEEQQFQVTRERQVVSVPSRARGDFAPEPVRRNPAQLASYPREAAFEDTDQFDLFKRPIRAPSPPVWKYLAIPLVLLFLIQVFNQYSPKLARNPRFGNAVLAVYNLLGVDLIPDWNLRAYDIRSYRVVVDPAMPGTLRVRATIRNRAAFPQPYPLLKLVLEDRYGEAVKVRAFEPIEYLDKPPAPNARLEPNKDLTGNVVIVDPGSDASGYRFDICLRGNNGPVCIEDLPMISP